MNEQIQENATQLDGNDPLKVFRGQFHFPVNENGDKEIYLVGNSLGLQPKRTVDYVNEVLDKWRTLGVRGHVESDYPWLPYHEFLAPGMAQLVGANQDEVVVMNSLTANLHLMMATFYRPNKRRKKILIERHAFPSDHFAVESQIRWHNNDPEECLLAVGAGDEELIEIEQLLQTIDDHAEELALILLPGVQYYTGQFLEIEKIVETAHRNQIPIGFDLAHAAGNVPLELHKWGVDFAVWCTYKYLNSGPGSVGGCFIHRAHATDTEKVRLAGWWGHDKETRFEMKNEFRAIPTAEGWQLSNPPILSMAAIRASLDMFTEAGGMKPLRQKSVHLTGYLEQCLKNEFGDRVQIITPTDPSLRGCQLSLQIDFGDVSGRAVHEQLEASAVRCDWREPNVIRAAPAPLYNSFEDVGKFVEVLKKIAS